MKTLTLSEETVDKLTADNLEDTWRIQDSQIKCLEGKDSLKDFEVEDLTNMRHTRTACEVLLHYFHGDNWYKRLF